LKVPPDREGPAAPLYVMEYPMSFIDKIAAAIMPQESDEDRATARRNVRAIAGDSGWLATIIDQHRQIEAAFARALGASDAMSRAQAVKGLGLLLTAHANAEESVIYPAMADNGEKSGAGMAYEEQATTKIEMAKLEQLDPMSREWSEKLEHIRGAVLHHVYEEEGTWFPKLHQELLPDRRNHLAERFAEEFKRNMGR
jgi:hemerythrin superfamily protein